MYKRMYYRLFNRVTDAIKNCKDLQTIEILKKAQLETEEMFINNEEEKQIFLNN